MHHTLVFPAHLNENRNLPRKKIICKKSVFFESHIPCTLCRGHILVSLAKFSRHKNEGVPILHGRCRLDINVAAASTAPGLQILNPAAVLRVSSSHGQLDSILIKLRGRRQVEASAIGAEAGEQGHQENVYLRNTSWHRSIGVKTAHHPTGQPSLVERAQKRIPRI